MESYLLDIFLIKIQSISIAFGQSPAFRRGNIKSHRSTESRDKKRIKKVKMIKILLKKESFRCIKTADCDLPIHWAALRAARQVGTWVRLYKLARTYFIKGG